MSESLNYMGSDWSVLLKPTVRRILDAMLAGAKTLTEISDHTGMTKPALVPHLKALVALGAVEGLRVPTPSGSEAHYRLRDVSFHLSIHSAGPRALAWAGVGAWSSEFPLLNQIPQPAVRTELAKLLAELRERHRDDTHRLVVIVFGSAARGETTWKSDLDLLVLVESRDPALERAFAEAAFQAQMSTQHAFTTTFVTRDEWATSRKRLVAEAREEGMIIWGGDDAPWSTMKRYGAIDL